MEGHPLGKGRVFAQGEIEPLLARMALAADFAYTTPTNVLADLKRPMPRGDSEDDLVYIHRDTGEGQIYFVATQKTHTFDTEASFRVTGREPMTWDPMTGKRHTVSFSTHDGVTTIPLHFEAEGSVFVVFGARSGGQGSTVPAPKMGTARDFSPGWTLNFPKGVQNVSLNDLSSWTESTHADEKYFSGTATYTKTFELSSSEADNNFSLDLGDVREIAQVTINGLRLEQILWAPPYRVATNHLLHAGRNTISVEVTNLWPNRMIGDEQPGVTERHTFTGIHAFTKDSPLLPSGMLGPVTLMKER